MAEFQEVMREWVRARKAMSSNTDEDVLSVYSFNDYDDELITDIEKNVMAWAAEHPEPIYPTWWEWLENIGIVSKISEHSKIYDTTKMYDSIPADIAQKLGLQPKEGT